jgi:hypothetical protein
VLLKQAAAARGQLLRFHFYRLTAAAATLLLTCGLLWMAYRARQPVFDTHQLVAQNDAWLQDPTESLSRWLEQQRLPTELPVRFDLNLLEHAGYEMVHGDKVPVLLFRHPLRPGLVAKLYFLRYSGAYQVQHLTDVDASHSVARVIVEPQRISGIAYVIVYPAGPEGLGPFLRPEPLTP